MGMGGWNGRWAVVVVGLVLVIVVVTVLALHQRPAPLATGSGAPTLHPRSRADREATIALLLVPGVIVAMVADGLWTIVVGTASLGGDESELHRGWAGIARDAPGALVLIGVGVTSVVLAARSMRSGAARAKRALLLGSVALLVALAAVTRDGAEVMMQTRSATAAWILFAVDTVIVTATYVLARRWALRKP
jgi:hypothetical protein